MKPTFPTACSLALFGCALLATTTLAGDWARFRGPDGLGASAETGLPTKWSETENLKWRLDLPGPGSSSPIVQGDKLFVTCYSGYGDGDTSNAKNLTRHLFCVHPDTGAVIWKKEIPATHAEDSWSGWLREHGYASHTPVCDGERVYVFCGKTGIVAFDMKGNEVWRENLGTLSANRRWGSAASPILYGDLLIVNASEEGRAIYALDKKTGKQVWKYKSNLTELTYCTPAIAEGANGQKELVTAVPGEVWGIDPDTGKKLWTVTTSMKGNISPSVLAIGDTAYVLGGYPRQYTLAIKTGGRGDVTGSRVLWTSRDSSYIPSPVEHDGHLYWVGHKGNAFCVEAATGKTVYKEKLKVSGGNPVYASATYADGKLYVPSRTGGIFVLAAKPEFEVLATNYFDLDMSDFNGSPAISGGKLFFRSNQSLYCVADK